MDLSNISGEITVKGDNGQLFIIVDIIFLLEYFGKDGVSNWFAFVHERESGMDEMLEIKVVDGETKLFHIADDTFHDELILLSLNKLERMQVKEEFDKQIERN